jgi:hypothetical protein
MFDGCFFGKEIGTSFNELAKPYFIFRQPNVCVPSQISAMDFVQYY